MRLEFFPFPLFIGIGILAALLPIFWRRKCSIPYLFCFSLFWLYLLLVIRMIVFPIPLPVSLGGDLSVRQPAAAILSRVNLAPFSFGGLFSLSSGVIFDNLVGNVLLTLPFGFSAGLIFRMPAKRIPWLAVAAGLTLETAQLAISLLIGAAYRGVDINDVLLNALGVLIGYGFYRVFAWLYKAGASRLGIEPKSSLY